MEGIVALFIPIAAFMMVFGIVYVERSAKNREIMAAIEKGMDPSAIKIDFKKKNSSLRDGALLVGVSLGLLLGYFLTAMTDINHALAYLSMAFLGGGIALLRVHSIEAKKEENRRYDEKEMTL